LCFVFAVLFSAPVDAPAHSIKWFIVNRLHLVGIITFSRQQIVNNQSDGAKGPLLGWDFHCFQLCFCSSPNLLLRASNLSTGKDGWQMTGVLSANLLLHYRYVFTRWQFFGAGCLTIYKKGQ
jgi:hypothetical protein